MRWQLNCCNDAGVRKSFTSYVLGRLGRKTCQDKADAWIRTGIVSSSAKASIYLDMYLQDLEEFATKSDYSPRKSHIKNYIRPATGNKKLIQITEADWENIVRRAAKTGLSYKYLSDIRGTIIHFCKWAKKRRYIASLPDLECGSYKNAPKGQRRILQPKDIQALFSDNHMSYTFRKEEIFCRNIFLFRFLVLSGFRSGEVIGLRKSDICFEKHTISIRQAINRFGEITAGKTKNAQRTIYMMPQLESVVYAQLALASSIESEYVFPAQNVDIPGKPQRLNVVYEDWMRWVKHNNTNYCSLHELRHTFYSYAKDHISVERLKDYLGHSESMDSSKVYGHTVESELKRTADDISVVFDTLLPKTGT